LRIPFLFFPVEHQSEQEVTIANRLARHKAGIRMNISSISPEDLADAIISNLGNSVSYEEIPVYGVQIAARRILKCAGISV